MKHGKIFMALQLSHLMEQLYTATNEFYNIYKHFMGARGGVVG
jgi:hypothetical protein